jgi:transcriptional regulator with XRE-family HTH domain
VELFDELGHALRWIRSRTGRSQVEIAGRAGITKAMISAYERGTQTPSTPTLGRVLAALGADLHVLQDALDLQQDDLPQLAASDPSKSSDRC